MAELILASSSPRRQALLRYLELPFTVDPSGIDETAVPASTPPDLVRILAQAKAQEVAARHPTGVVIGADTLVDLDGAVLAKPVDSADAVGMLVRLMGRTHRVHTGLAVCGGGECTACIVSSTVTMRRWSEEQVQWYVATGEPLDKAGAYAAQGLGAGLIERVEGSFLAVVGLPLLALRDLLDAVGIVTAVPQDRLEALEQGLLS
jgi:septum formation protein